MIAAGANVRAPFGTYRVHRVTAAEVVLQDLERPTAFVVRRADQVADLEVVAAIAIAAAPRARAAAPPAPIGRGALPWRLTLGASPPGAGFCSLLPFGYWAPCLTRSIGEDGKTTAEPHLWWIATWGRDGSLFCPACADARAAIPAAAPIAAPVRMAPEQAADDHPDEITPARQPWGTTRPIWAEPEHRARAAELRERWEERAAILECLGGETRERADHIAYEMLVAELRPELRPAARSAA